MNGALSSGPTTPTGKTRSSQNSLKHGLYSKQILLPTESADDYRSLVASYFAHFEPITPLEAELVETLAATRWRLRRLASIETDLFTNHSLEKARHIPADVSTPDARLAWSFKNLADASLAFPLIIRYESTLSRTFDRCLKQLLTMQKRRNEPTVPAP
jgi:hypothetical protein